MKLRRQPDRTLTPEQSFEAAVALLQTDQAQMKIINAHTEAVNALHARLSEVEAAMVQMLKQGVSE